MLTRYFTKGMDGPYSDIEWEYRDIAITRPDGSAVFEQKDVHVPSTWSMNATTILAQKYFRGVLGSPERESSLQQVIHRVVQTIVDRGRTDGYFVDDEQAKIFMDELSYVLAHQMASFNSPVWFNIGVEGVPQQSSACFILSVEDEMESILNWYREEGIIFKGGSGAGVNLSGIRSSHELLKGGGTASGPVSFMRGADSSAGTIKSGGKCLAPWQKVYTAEWGAAPVSELAERGDFTVLSYDPPAGRVKAKTARAWKSGVKRLVRITTDKGSFDLSADHPVYLADLKTVVPAGELKSGNALLATSVHPSGGGYARVWLHDGGKGRKNLHELVADDIFGREPGRVVHHRDHDKLNNAPDNLVCATQAEHAKLHGMELATVGRHVFQLKNFSHGGRSNGMHHSNAFWNDDAKATAYRHRKSEELYNRGTARELQKKASRSQRMNLAYGLINEGYDITTFEGYCKARLSHGGWDRRTQEAEKGIVSGFGSYENFYKELCTRNHRVVSVTELSESEVYDVEVDCATSDDKTAASGHNFAIWADDGRFGSGIFVSNTRRAAAMRILNIDHPDIEEFIWCKSIEERKARALRDAGFDMSLDGKDGFSVQYQNANNSVRVTDEFMEAVLEDNPWELRAVKTGEGIRTMRARDLMRQIAQAAWECADPGLQFDTTINHWHTTPNAGRISGSNPCSEFLSLDNSSCNLASLNLLSFLHADGTFDVESFVHTASLVFTAQDILINHSDYPTEAITETTHSFRQLGLGYANLGALLMTLGLPYDSDGGRALAATLTALMTGVAYKTSAELASQLGAFSGFEADRDGVIKVLEMHRDAVGKIDRDLVPFDLFLAACDIWTDAMGLAYSHGVRNAQATLLAPTGTISFLMDCDTTGIEPAFSLVSYKKLVGGGNMVIPVQCVDPALRRLGYNEEDRELILDGITNGVVLGSESRLNVDHLPVFATAVGENSISAKGTSR